MKTAMNASKNMSTPPTKGNTMGINGTMASVASGAWVSCWGVGADIVFLRFLGCFAAV
jgi:hypothetical protein